jgi:hypothetical protein
VSDPTTTAYQYGYRNGYHAEIADGYEHFERFPANQHAYGQGYQDGTRDHLEDLSETRQSVQEAIHRRLSKLQPKMSAEDYLNLIGP